MLLFKQFSVVFVNLFHFEFAVVFTKAAFHTHFYILQHTDHIFRFGHSPSSGE
jgi:hypothetical protein